jgi:hypothetical protein
MGYIPLHHDPLERELKLKAWLNLVTKDLGAELLSPEG